jgi:hypothetical protein
MLRTVTEARLQAPPLFKMTVFYALNGTVGVALLQQANFEAAVIEKGRKTLPQKLKQVLAIRHACRYTHTKPDSEAARIQHEDTRAHLPSS